MASQYWKQGDVYNQNLYHIFQRKYFSNKRNMLYINFRLIIEFKIKCSKNRIPPKDLSFLF